MSRATFPIALAVAGTVLAACSATPKAPPSVEGTWLIASAKLAGAEMPLSAFAGGPLQLTNGKYIFQNDSGEYVVNNDVSPATIDVMGKQGPNAGKTLPAIFKINGDTLTICYDLSGTTRPTAFASDSGSKAFLAQYTRAPK